MQDGACRDLDEIGEIRTEIKALMLILRGRPGIAVEEHHIGDVLRIGDDLVHERRAARWFTGLVWLSSLLGHRNPSFKGPSGTPSFPDQGDSLAG
jgi:hypothetical protein